MKCASFEHVQDLNEALSLAYRYNKLTSFVAGATDVLVKARESNFFDGRHIIDISDIDKLKKIEIKEDNKIHIGALSSHAQISSDEIINKHARALALACSEVGSPQIRNRGTLGGNIANASPAADSFAALTILHAILTIESVHGRRFLPFEDIIAGPYNNTLLPDELITEVVIDCLEEEYTHGFIKIGRRKALAISRLTAAGTANVDSDGKVLDLRLALGSVFPKPVMFDDVTLPFIGKAPTAEAISQAAILLSNKIPEIAGIRPSTQYKQPAAKSIIEELLTFLLGGHIS